MSPAQLYASSWHQPGLLLATALFSLAWQADRWVTQPRAAASWPPAPDRLFLQLWVLLAAAEIALDAACTGTPSPLSGSPGLARALSFVFVLLGDWRAYLLLERGLRPRARWRWTALRSLAWALAPSLGVALALRLAPGALRSERHGYLLYESLALALFAGWRVRATGLGRQVAAFYLAVYALWAASDALILGGGGAP